jgi:hypothetical protein
MKAIFEQVEQSLRQLGYGSALSASMVNTSRDFIERATERGRTPQEIASTLDTNRKKTIR